MNIGRNGDQMKAGCLTAVSKISFQRVSPRKTNKKKEI